VAELRVDKHDVAHQHRKVTGDSGWSTGNTGAELPRQHHSRDLYPGDGSECLVELHRVSQQRHDD